MNGRIIRMVSVMCLFVTYLSAGDISSAMDKTKEFEKAVIQGLQSEDINERYKALLEINKYAKEYELSEQVVTHILRLAKKERDSGAYRSMGEFGEEFSSELIIALGNTRNRNAVDELMHYLGGGTLVIRNLLKIGEPAIDPLIEKLNHDVVGYRSSAAYGLGEFIRPKKEGYTVKGNLLTKIKKALVKELNNKRNKNPKPDIEWYEFRARERAVVRKNIVQALGHFAEEGDGESIAIIKSLAENDPYYEDFSKKKNYTGPKQRYKVREKAQEIMGDLKNKGIIK